MEMPLVYMPKTKGGVDFNKITGLAYDVKKTTSLIITYKKAKPTIRDKYLKFLADHASIIIQAQVEKEWTDEELEPSPTATNIANLAHIVFYGSDSSKEKAKKKLNLALKDFKK
jgi:hypothetical protein